MFVIVTNMKISLLEIKILMLSKVLFTLTRCRQEKNIEIHP